MKSRKNVTTQISRVTIVRFASYTLTCLPRDTWTCQWSCHCFDLYHYKNLQISLHKNTFEKSHLKRIKIAFEVSAPRYYPVRLKITGN